jgi:hypothetical protein
VSHTWLLLTPARRLPRYAPRLPPALSLTSLQNGEHIVDTLWEVQHLQQGGVYSRPAPYRFHRVAELPSYLLHRHCKRITLRFSL